MGLPYMGRSLAMSPDGKHVAVGFKEGAGADSAPVWVVEFESLTTVSELESCEEYVSSLKYSPDGKYLAVGSWDQTAHLYEVSGDSYKLQYVLTENSSSVEHVMFSADRHVLMTHSKGTQALFWETSTGARITRAWMMRDVEWAQWTGTLGWSMMGIWDPEYDQTDVNAVCQSVSGTALVFGDDYGKVKLVRYPAAVEGTAACAAYGGHSSHGTCVRFSHDESHVVSTGGGDVLDFIGPGQGMVSSPQCVDGSSPPRSALGMKRASKKMGTRAGDLSTAHIASPIELTFSFAVVAPP